MAEPPEAAEPLPDDWAEIDLARCFGAYTAYCREAHLRGEPVAEVFRARRGGEAPP